MRRSLSISPRACIGKGGARWRRRKHALAGDLEEAHRKNQPARAYNIIRQLAAKGMGSKKRAYRAPQSNQPSRVEWVLDLSKPGLEGGMSAEFIEDWKAEFKEH